MKKLLFAAAAILFLSSPASAFNPLEALKGAVQSATATNEFKISSLEGTWNYSSPAISFKSDDALSQLGGAATSSTIEENIAPYYEKLQLNNTVITFDAEGNFQININKLKLKGKVSKDEESKLLVFNFSPTLKVNIGKVSAKATKDVSGNLTITFDATKLVRAAQKVASFAKNSNLNSISEILDKYDNIYLGADFTK